MSTNRRKNREDKLDKTREYKLQQKDKRKFVVRREKRSERIKLRGEIKLGKINARQQGRTDRTNARKQYKNILAEQGIDPNKAMYDMIGSGIESAGSAVSSVFGGGGFLKKNDEFNMENPLNTEIDKDNQQGNKSSIIMWIVGGLLLVATIIGSYYIFKKKH